MSIYARISLQLIAEIIKFLLSWNKHVIMSTLVIMTRRRHTVFFKMFTFTRQSEKTTQTFVLHVCD